MFGYPRAPSEVALPHFAEAQSTAGEVTLHFSDGAAIRLGVECIEAQMKDLGPIWEAAATPAHPDQG